MTDAKIADMFGLTEWQKSVLDEVLAMPPGVRMFVAPPSRGADLRFADETYEAFAAAFQYMIDTRAARISRMHREYRNRARRR